MAQTLAEGWFTKFLNGNVLRGRVPIKRVVNEVGLYISPPEKQLPKHILDLANLRGQEFAWKIKDVPAVIEAAREANLAILGGNFQLRIPDGPTHDYWYVNIPISDDDDSLLPWAQRVQESAREATEQFESLVNEIDLFAIVSKNHGRTFWNRLLCWAYDDNVLRSSMYFIWTFETKAEALEALE